MQKRGQLLAQPLMAILALVTLAFILYFGFYLVNHVFSTASILDTKVFEKNLQQEITSVYQRSTGSSKVVALAVPSAVTQICFLDLNKNIDKNNLPVSLQSQITLLQRTSSTKNVFFVVSQGEQPQALALQYLKPLHPVCASTLNGQLKIVFENQGDAVDVHL